MNGYRKESFDFWRVFSIALSLEKPKWQNYAQQLQTVPKDVLIVNLMDMSSCSIRHIKIKKLYSPFYHKKHFW